MFLFRFCSSIIQCVVICFVPVQPLPEYYLLLCLLLSSFSDPAVGDEFEPKSSSLLNPSKQTKMNFSQTNCDLFCLPTPLVLNFQEVRTFPNGRPPPRPRPRPRPRLKQYVEMVSFKAFLGKFSPPLEKSLRTPMPLH